MLIQDAWATEIWPFIKDDFAYLSQQRPRTQEAGSVGCSWGAQKVLQALTKAGELRGVTCNLCWVKPLAMAPFGKDLTQAMLEKFTRSFWYKNEVMDVPSNWPARCNVPIAVFSKCDEPVKGEFRRTGLDLVVLSVWQALAWAVKEQNEEWDRVDVPLFPGP